MHIQYDRNSLRPHKLFIEWVLSILVPSEHLIINHQIANMGLIQGLAINDVAKLLIGNFAFIAIAVGAVLAFYNWRSYSKLSHIPGPFSAAVSNLPRLSWVYGREAQHKHVALHRQYGPLVRFGPNMVSIGDPAEIPKIYSFKGTYVKVGLVLYHAFSWRLNVIM